MSVLRSSERRQAAPSRRVPAALARAIVEDGDAAAIAALVANPAAELDRETLAVALSACPDDDRVHAAMIGRATLPAEIVQRLGTLVADHRIPALVRRHAAPECGANRFPHAVRATGSSG